MGWIFIRRYCGKRPQVKADRPESNASSWSKVVVDRDTVKELYKAGNSIRVIASEMGLTKSTVHNIEPSAHERLAKPRRSWR